MTDTAISVNLRAETIDRTVKGFALQEYKLKQVMAVSNSSSWMESYWQESSTELTGGTGSSVRGIPRLAAFPYGEPNWTKKSAYLEKYGMQGQLSYENILTDSIDVLGRTLLRIARAVTKSVDDQIWSALTTDSNIQTININTNLQWDNLTGISGSSVNILDDLMQAKQLIMEQNYSPDNAFLLVSPKDHRSIVSYLAQRGAQFPTLSATATSNGNAGNLAGLRIVVSNSVVASGAVVIVGQEAASWKSAVPLTVVTIDDPGIKKTVRAWEIGTSQVINPKAIVWIKNTQK